MNRVKGTGTEGFYFPMLWKHQSSPHEPKRVRRPGYFRWGKAALEAFVCSLGTQLLREAGEHVTGVVTKLIIELLTPAPVTLAEHIEILPVLVAPVDLLRINKYVKGEPVRPWNKTQGTGGKRASAFLPVLEGP